ncbi:unnamed protein product [Ectocarpus sp. CCAP 1310/34]|nr:unnamed protein product [Ectocarpus sp. CCAP 1310/34]
MQRRQMNLGLKTDGKKHVLPIPPAWTEVALRVSERRKALVTGRSRSRLTYSVADLILPRVSVALAPTPLCS